MCFAKVFSGLKPLKPFNEYQTLYSTVLLARCCALGDIPTADLEKHSKDGKTQFHRMVYSAAKDLDETFADEIQACIVK